MRVLLDVRAIPATRLGVAQYAIRIARAAAGGCDLEVLAKQVDAHEFTCPVHATSDRSRVGRLLSELILDASLVNRIGPDVFHGLHYSLPPRLKVPATVTFHDATMLTMPEVHERSKVLWFRRAIPDGIARASQVICVSESARQGAIEFAGADPARTHTVPLAVDHDFYRPGAGEASEVAQLVDGPYVLWVGAIEPRKDVPTLLEAFASIADDIPHSLVLAGPDAWGVDAVDRWLASNRHAPRVIRTGWITEEQKRSLYVHADVFAYPSLAEGFGLPVLEAMACGTPTVTTTGSAQEEVAGDGASLVPVRDPRALADAILGALGPDRERLQVAGPARAAHFTWEATAAATIDVWRLACE